MTEATKDANAEEQPAGPIPAFAGWICAALSIAYTLYIHQGLGIPPGGMATEWYHATNTLTNYSLVGGWIDTPVLGTFWLTLPTIVLTIVCAIATRSAIARTVCICTIVLAALIAIHGLAFTGIWDFFHWRWSLVLFWSGLFVGLALAAPLLAASWLRLRGWAQALTYVPPAFVSMMIIIHTTGTDPELFFNLSPWPVITGFALRIGVYSILGVYLGIAVGLGVEALGRGSALWTIVGAALAFALPLVWFVARFGAKEMDAPVGIGLVGLVGFGLAQWTSGRARIDRLAARSVHVAVGVVLVAIPLFSGRAIAVGNHSYTRDVAAANLITALRTYYHANEEYPDELSELVTAGILDEIPQPRIGYGFVHALGLTEPQQWKYQMLGSSYLLEFSSTEWVMCTYSSPWEPLDDEEEDWGDDEGLEEENQDPWSCPQRPPDLWGGPEQGAAADEDAVEDEEGGDY